MWCRMHRLIIVVVMVARLAVALCHTHSTVFKKTSEVTITRSKWIMTFVIDLGSYRKVLWNLEHGVTVASELRVQMQLNQSAIGIEANTAFFISLGEKLSKMKQRLKCIKVAERSQKRFQKRLVLPLIRKALNVLFGTM